MQKLFLTGRPRSGKSSVIQRMLANYNLPVGGFAIQRLTNQGATWAFRLVDLSEEQYITHRETSSYYSDIAIYMRSPDKWQGDAAVFDHKGSRALEKCLQTQPLVIMDELGIFESESLIFQASVLKLLDSSLPVLGVIKDKSNPFLDQVRKLPQIKLERYPGAGVQAQVENYLHKHLPYKR